MELIANNFMPGDPRLIGHILYELKAQGIFDQFRKECIADVDTKPAYQNLRQRVEGNVMSFLGKQKWSADLNKNQVREMLRKNIAESGFLDTGVERIVDQVVNPKINTVFLPHVEKVVYKFLGIEKPSVEGEKPADSDCKPSEISSNQNDLLPNDLEAVSPESETIEKKNEQSHNSEKLDESKMDDDESPPFEPLEQSDTPIAHDENSVDSRLSGISGLASHDSNHSENNKFKIDFSNPDSQFSKHSSGDGHLSIDSDKMDISEDSSQSRPKWTEVENKCNDPNSNSFSFNLNQQKLEIDTNIESSNIDIDNKEILLNDSNKDAEMSDCSEIKKVNEKNVDDEELKEIGNEKLINDDKKTQKHRHSDKNKSKHERIKEKDHKDKERKESKEKNNLKESKNRKSDKDKYKNEKDKHKSDKEKDKHKNGSSKSDKDNSKTDKSKENKSKSEKSSDKYEKDKIKSDKNKDRDKSQKEKYSSDKSKNEKDKLKENKDKSKDKNKDSEKKDKIISESKHKNEKSDESKEKLSSSKHKSSKKDNEKNSKHRLKSESESDHKTKQESKHKKKNDSKSYESKDKSESKHKKDEKRDKSRDSKRDSKKSNIDDHYDSKGKKWDRRSTDRDSSDGRSGNHSSQGSISEGNQKQKRVQESSNGSGSGDSGNSDNAEGLQDAEINIQTDNNFHVDDMPVKIIKPKFASNFNEAMRLMKIRKQLHKLEKQNQINCLNNLKNNAVLCNINEDDKFQKTKINISDSIPDLPKETDEIVDDESATKIGEKIDEMVPPPLADQIITKESWDALEAKLSQQNLLEDYEDDSSKQMALNKENNEEKCTTKISLLGSETTEMDNVLQKDTISNKKPEESNKKPEESNKKSEELEEGKSVSHFNLNSPPVDNLVHLKNSLEKIEQDISRINSFFDKKRKVTTEGEENKEEKNSDDKKEDVENSNSISNSLSISEDVDMKCDNQITKYNPKKGKKRKKSAEVPFDHHNNNDISNNVNTKEDLPLELNDIPAESKCQNSPISLNSKIPAKKKKTEKSDGVKVKDVATVNNISLCSIETRKNSSKNEKKEKEVEPVKISKKKTVTERVSANLQRYSSDDLYKPRLNFNSRRRSARALGND